MRVLKSNTTSRKYLRVIFILIITLQQGLVKSQPYCVDFPFNGLVTNCNSSTTLRTDYCYGENVCFKVSSPSYALSAISWKYTGSFTSMVSTPPAQYSGNVILTGGLLSVSGKYMTPGGLCPFNLGNYVITVHQPNITTTSPVLFVAGSNVSLNSTPSGVTPPATYNWLPNLYFVPLNSNNVQNPVVNPPTSLIYTVTVADQYGCTATNTIEVIAQPYAKLTKTPEGSYYILTADNKLLFKYEEQYATTKLIYNIYDKNNTAIASDIITPSAMNLVNVTSGDNRCYFDASSLTSGYYTLEVINEKKEKLYLRFIK